MYVRSSFTVVNLHDLWNNYSRSISTVIDLVCESGRHPGGKPKSLRSDWSMSVSMSNAVSVRPRRMAFLDIALIRFLSSAVSRPAYAGRA